MWLEAPWFLVDGTPRHPDFQGSLGSGVSTAKEPGFLVLAVLGRKNSSFTPVKSAVNPGRTPIHSSLVWLLLRITQGLPFSTRQLGDGCH